MGEDIDKKIKELEQQLQDLKLRLPSEKDRKTGVHVHADSMEMIMKIEELEDEIEELKDTQP